MRRSSGIRGEEERAEVALLRAATALSRTDEGAWRLHDVARLLLRIVNFAVHYVSYEKSILCIGKKPGNASDFRENQIDHRKNRGFRKKSTDLADTNRSY